VLKGGAALAVAFAVHAGAAMDSEPPLQAHVAVHRLPVVGPRGVVLYDQSSTSDNAGALVRAAADGRAVSMEGADDFLVGPAGWTVTGFVLNAFGADGAGVIGAPPAHLDLAIYDDAGGTPSASARCSYASLETTYKANPWYSVSVGLPSACTLPQGRYWIAAAFAPTADETSSGYWGQTREPHNAPALVRGSAAKAHPCPAWAPFAGCGLADTGSRDFGFQVLGTAGTAGGDCADGLCLAVTLAEDNGDPAQCGTATSLDVARGHRVNYCYVVTNHSATTLNYHFLSDTVSGLLFEFRQHPLAPGESYQYNRVILADEDVQPTATWTATSTPPDYSANVGAGEFIDITASGTALNLGGLGTALVQMPFSFSLYTTTSSTLCVSTDGLILFDASSDRDCNLNGSENTPRQFFPSFADGHPLAAIEPFWDDLDFHGNVYYATLGEAPQRQFVVEWSERDHYDQTRGSDYVTFEVVFDESSGLPSFRYRNVAFGDPNHPAWDNGGSATVSLQSGSSDFIVNLYSFNTPSLVDDSTIAWTRTPVTSHSASAQVQVHPELPVAQVAPPSIDVSAAAGATATATLVVGNSGDHVLDWSIGTAAAASRAHFPPVPAFVVPMHDPGATFWGIAPPRPPSTAKTASAGLRLPFGAAGVAAYAQDDSAAYYVPSSFVRFPDLADASSSSTAVMLWQYALGADFIDNDFSTVYAVDLYNELITIPTDGSGGGSFNLGYDVVGSLTNLDVVGEWAGLKWDASTGTLYGVRLDLSGRSYLYTIDRHTALISLVGPLPADMLLIDIAIDAEGHMFGLDIANSALVAIDKTSGDAAPLGSIGFNAQYAQGMDFDDSSGILYLAGYDGDSLSGGLYTVNVVTGAATLIGPLGDGREFDAFAIASPTPGCSNPADIPWLAFSPGAGTTDPGATSTVAVTLDATELEDGVYRANACLHNNGFVGSAIAVPVTFTVGSGIGDRIFENGFEGGAR
jgi:hypothetical protein